MGSAGSSEQIAANIEEPLERLLAFEPTPLPVLSVYLNTQPDAHGRAPDLKPYLQREFAALARTWPASSEERQSFDRDAERVLAYVEEQVAYNQPHLYHLARIEDEYPRYAALVTDANTARIFVFGLGQTIDAEEVKGKKVHRVKVGGWSQARYQRRVGNAHQQHAKEIMERLERIVSDVMSLDSKSADHEVLDATLARMREEDARSDAERVDRLIQEYRARGLAVVGPERTLEALANGQVDELVISAALEEARPEREEVEAVLAPEIPDASGGTESDNPFRSSKTRRCSNRWVAWERS